MPVMRWLVDLAWLMICLLSAPVLVPRLLFRGWQRTDWAGRRGRVPAAHGELAKGWPHVFIHAVSVGEVNAIRTLVPLLLAQGCRVTVSVTTDTGTAQATRLFGDVASVVRYPLDLSCWVERFLEAIKPDVVAFVELELWPNFTSSCARRGIAMQVIGGRLSARSARRYGWIAPLVRPMFRRLAGVHALDATCAKRFCRFGAPSDGVRVVGGLKWDNATPGTAPDGTSLAHDMGIDLHRPLVVVGSSAPEEHEAIRDAIPEGVQLLCAPRRPEWWDEAATVLDGCARRSSGDNGSASGRFVLDTIGELSMAYALADVVIIGRSFGDRHGSDPVEPLGMGKAVVCGGAMSDFAAALQVLRDADAIVETTLGSLSGVLVALLGDNARRAAMAERGCEAIKAAQGASEAAASRLLALAAG